MKLPRRKILYLAAGAVAMVVSTIAWAQNYPSHTIKIVVPYPAGGPTDLVARIIAEKIRGPLGQPIIVENVAGGSEINGVARVARAAPDGYTLILGNNGSNVLNGALYSLSFDLIEDFEPVARLTTNPQVIVTRKSIPAKDLSELLVDQI